MALLRKLNTKAKAETNTGFGANASDYGGRFVNKDGKPNIERKGISILESISWYHKLLQIAQWKFIALIFAYYILINFAFAILYVLIGTKYLNGIDASTAWGQFGEAYFFSAQTFTTVGYGHVSPTGFLTSTLSAIEALVGLLTFAIATGLFYGRFSRPRAYLRFSEKAILAPFKDGLAIMFRVAAYKNNNLTDAEAKVTAGVMVEENGKVSNKFFNMELEYSKVNALTLSWTIVHPITEESPFYKFSLEDFKNSKGEILVFVKAFDDMFSNTVASRSSYTLDELVIGAKFVPMFHRSKDSGKTILDLDKLGTYTAADINFAFTTESNIANA